MKDEAWDAFCVFRDAFRAQTDSWRKEFADALAPLQIESAKNDTPDYPLETPVVYNAALDEISRDDEIKIILIGDNPGKDEQRKKNRRYLVGQSGKVADGFFKKNPALGIDFRKNVVILNKTPVHTAKTKHLRHLLSFGGAPIQSLLRESQTWMAERTAKLHQSLFSFGTRLWLVGYSELKEKGIFTEYKQSLFRAYQGGADPAVQNMIPAWDSVLVFQHFSMNCFLTDLNRYRENSAREEPSRETLFQSLNNLGILHRKHIFGV
ncbi:MAG: hypothetical protein Pg6C_09370 [Treponemataceae bacterium]|nr:MAG: hypothetical protein Pg6C_09370 [Treponemataceae bacterium]